MAAVCCIRKEMIKNKSKEYRERSESRKRQHENYAEAVQVGATYDSSGATGATTQSPDITPLTTEEMKLIITTIMSAVIYLNIWRHWSQDLTKRIEMRCIN